MLQISQFILLFNLFLLLFMGLIELFGTIHKFQCTIFTVLSGEKKKFSFRKINGSQIDPKCVFGSKLKSQLILLFSLFLLLLDHIALFGIIYGSHYFISANFYLYLQYFQQKIFCFSKISRF